MKEFELSGDLDKFYDMRDKFAEKLENLTQYFKMTKAEII